MAPTVLDPLEWARIADAKDRAVLAALSDPGRAYEERLEALRHVKNKIIGNRSKKESFIRLGVLPALVQLLSDPDPQLKMQAAVAVGSFAHGNDTHVSSITGSQALPPLLQLLLSPDVKLVEAALRALKQLYSSTFASRHEIFRLQLLQDRHRQHNSFLSVLVSLVGPSPGANPVLGSIHPHAVASLPNLTTSELAAAVIARIVITEEDQKFLIDACEGSVLQRLCFLVSKNHTKAQESALDALRAVSKKHHAVCQQIIEMRSEAGEKLPSLLLKMVRDKRPTIRLLACSCLANLIESKVWSGSDETPSLIVLSALVKLLGEPGPKLDAVPYTFAYLVSGGNEKMQKSVFESDAVSKLATLLSTLAADGRQANSVDLHAEKTKEGLLLAVAAVASLGEDCRKQVIDAKILPHIVSSLESPVEGVRTAACFCTRNLSRSVKNLRTSLVDAGITGPLFKLLSDPSNEVVTAVTAALCNIVLEFTPMKKSLIESGGVDRLIGFVDSTDHALRLNAVWALKNLLYNADSDTKESVMRQLGFAQLMSLLTDSSKAIQEQSLNLIRNVACNKEQDVELVFRGFGDSTLISILEEKLQYPCDDVLLQVLYIIVNISTGNERHKSAIMSSEAIVKGIYKHSSHSKASIRLATIWCIINLTWLEETPGVEERIMTLRSLGFEERLKAMVEDGDSDVKQQARAALSHMNGFGMK